MDSVLKSIKALKALLLGTVFVFPTVLFAATLSYQNLVKAAIWSTSPSQDPIDEFLSKLPEDFLSHFTLMHTSHSLQGASFERPRVIAYGEDAKLIIAFNGDPSQRNFNKIEIIRFDSILNRPVFSEIQFDMEADHGYRSPPKIVENPHACANCHTEALRWKWDAQVWAGAYGDKAPNDPFGARTEIGLLQFSHEFLSLPRYRHLKPAGQTLADHFRGGKPNAELALGLKRLEEIEKAHPICERALRRAI